MSTEEQRVAVLDERIRALPSPPPPAPLAAQVRARALAVLQEGGGAPRRAAGVATAAAVVSAVTLYLAWAVQFLSALAQG